MKCRLLAAARRRHGGRHPWSCKNAEKTSKYSVAFFLDIGAGMSHAREIHPGKTYLITRRTERRHCLLRPDSRMSRYIRYALIVSAHEHSIMVHAFCAMSTHLHYVVTDPEGNLPRFFEMFHRLLTRGIKIIRQWTGSPWERVQTSVVELCTRQAIIEAIAYTLANPVKAGLVQYAHQWPGAKTLVDDLGKNAVETERPIEYFSPSNPKWPLHGRLEVTLPPSIAANDTDAFCNAVREELENLEKNAGQCIPRSQVLGARRAMRISPESRITSREPKQQRNPRFAFGREASRETIKAAIENSRAFQSSYQKAWKRWRNGDRSVEFPPGTYAMRVIHKVCIATRS
jgi:putative transposase